MNRGVGLVLWGGRLDGREINSVRELDQAQQQVVDDGQYVDGERVSPASGRRVLVFKRHAV